MSDRVTDKTVETTELVESLLPAGILPPGDPVLEQDLDGMAERDGYGSPAPAVGVTEAQFKAAQAAGNHGPENPLQWVGEHLGYPAAMSAQKTPESPYGNPGKGV